MTPAGRLGVGRPAESRRPRSGVAVEGRHAGRQVTRARDVARRKDLVEQELVAGRQLDPGRRQVFAQAGAACGAEDRHDVRTLGQQPGQRDLARSGPGTRPMPSSRHAGSTVRSTPRSKREYSDWRALIGCTAWARRRVVPLASDSPRWRTLPARTNSAMVPMTSSIGTFGSTRCWYGRSIRSVLSRLRDCSTTSRTCSGRLSSRQPEPVAWVRPKPNLVASTTLSRREPPRTRPSSSSLVNRP